VAVPARSLGPIGREHRARPFRSDPLVCTLTAKSLRPPPRARTRAIFLAATMAACGAPPERTQVDVELVVARRAARVAPPGALSLAELRAAAVHTHPGLALARRRALAPLSEEEFVELWDDPTLQLDLERIVTGALDPLEWASLFSVTVPLGGEPAARAAELRAEAAHALSAAGVATLEHVERVDDTWLTWHAASLELAAHEAHAAALTPLVARAELAEAAGAIEHAEVDLLRLARATAETSAAGAARARDQRAAEVRRLVGLAGSAPLALAAPEPSSRPSTGHTPARTGQGPASNLASHPRVAVASAALAAAEARLEREWRARFGALGVGAGPGAKDGERTVLLGLALPLPLWNRNRAAIARAAAERDLAAEGAALAIEAALDAHERAQDGLEAAEAARARFEADVLPLTRAQLLRLESVAALGELRLLLLLEAQRAVRDAELTHAQLIVDEWRAALALARETEPLPHAAAPELPARD
jgi:cobalt-zinc-cadmium efflux system outer membrane protein